ncbi:MAG: co-chaperone GroES [Actinobacteria bacterium]|jgi:chaperonin GroES|nr:co-chaperone GroES [Actinomycetota bacterium]
MNKLTPLNGYVILKPIETQEETFGNIIIPDLGKERPEMGEVVATSLTYNFNTDTHVESKLVEGNIVLIPKLGSQRIVLDGQDYFICKETDIFAIVS